MALIGHESAATCVRSKEVAASEKQENNATRTWDRTLIHLLKVYETIYYIADETNIASFRLKIMKFSGL